MAFVFSRLFNRNKKPAEPIIVVSGLPRSGTSLMMQMLVAGGMEAVTDRIREADDSNPHGYYEFEQVKQLEQGNVAWVDDAQAKVVKVISALVPHLPDEHNYRVVFLRRDLDEIYRSQVKMLEREGKPTDTISRDELLSLYKKHLRSVYDWINRHPTVELLEIHYKDLVTNPTPQIQRLSAFIPQPLDEAAMHEAIDPSLYRNRS